MVEPSGSVATELSASRFDGGRPLACRAAHMAGSHATIAARLTCCPTQAAAAARAAAAEPTPPAETAPFTGVARLPGCTPAGSDSTTVTAPAANTNATTISAPTSRRPAGEPPSPAWRDVLRHGNRLTIAGSACCLAIPGSDCPKDIPGECPPGPT